MKNLSGNKCKVQCNKVETESVFQGHGLAACRAEEENGNC